MEDTYKPPHVRKKREFTIDNYHITTIDNHSGICHINIKFPMKPVIDSGAQNTMIGITYRKTLNITDDDLRPGSQYTTASGDIRTSMGSTKAKFPIILGAGTPNPTIVWIELHLSPSKDLDLLLGTIFIATLGGCIDTQAKKLLYRADWADGGHCLTSVPITVQGPPKVIPQILMADFEVKNRTTNDMHRNKVYDNNIRQQPLPASVLSLPTP